MDGGRELLRLLIGSLLTVSLLGACVTARPPAGTPTGALTGSLTVLVGDSLDDAVDDLAGAFAELHPDVEVTSEVAGGRRLAAAVEEDRGVGVLATADEQLVERLVDTGWAAGEPLAFATDRLALVVQAGNPREIRGLRDLRRPDVTVVLPTEDVPTGRAARTALSRAELSLEPVTVASDGREALSVVAGGEADATIGLRTSVEAHGGQLDGVPLPRGTDVRLTYLAITRADAEAPRAAEAFVDLLVSDRGQEILRSHRFGPPDPPGATP